ncbi:cysteine hydrolase family protein [Salimicrobium halophilum]|uniref:Nicotinamidase-related amidase n=1 Tax=Salimicrobium halophilum TaxID=86666 RepID=A0A1G8SZJ5_9BACI|nr:isochorismatase family cysteine hydrolase [Salimicrobium halophilum]SDJ34573.1 Nicotinamidase-related amidase [Salimicrobium halophilum]
MSSNTALLLIDFINSMDFEGGENLLENTKDIVPDVKALKQEAKSQNVPVIYVNDNFGLWQDHVDDLIEDVKKGQGRPVIEELEPSKDEYFILKPKHSGFYGTQLDILLQQLEVEQLIIAGIAGDICVLFTANDAYMRGYDLWVPENTSASEHKEDNENALRIVKRSLQADISSTKKCSIEDYVRNEKQ